jgi:hypothetical protein
MVDLGEPVAGNSAPIRGQAPWFGDFPRGIVGCRYMPVVFGVPVDTAQRGNEVFCGAAATTRIPPSDDVGLDVFGELLNL